MGNKGRDGENELEYREYRQFQWTFTPITTTQTKKPISSTVIFVNQGTSTAMIDNMIRLLPNESFTFEGYPGEINIHSFQINFVTGAGLQNNIVMVCKEYSK